MEKGGDRRLLVEAVPGGESGHVDPAQLAVLRGSDVILDRRHQRRIGRAAQRREQGVGLLAERGGHDATPSASPTAITPPAATSA